MVADYRWLTIIIYIYFELCMYTVCILYVAAAAATEAQVAKAMLINFTSRLHHKNINLPH